MRWTGRGLGGPSPGGRKLQPYALIRRARDRARGVLLHLHAEGRVTDRGINRARETAAKACELPSARTLPLTVYAAGRAADRGIDRARHRAEAMDQETARQDRAARSGFRVVG